MGHIGTGSDPTGSAYVADWEAAAARWNFFGERAASHGLKLYTHNHDIAYSFLLDSGPLDALGRPTRSSGIRRLEHFLANTDPKHVYLEMDIYWAHVAQYKHHTYTAPDGSVVSRSSTRPPGRRADARATRCSTPRTARSTRPRPTATSWRRSARATSTTRRSCAGSAPRARTTRCGSRTPHRAARRARAVAGVREGQLRQHGRPARLTRRQRRPTALRGRTAYRKTPGPGECRSRCSGALPGDRLRPSLSRRTYR